MTRLYRTRNRKKLFIFFTLFSLLFGLCFVTVPLALPENMVIIDLTVLHTDPMHILVIQMQNLENGQFIRQFYDYTNGFERAHVVHEIITDVATTIEPFNLDARHCFVQYR